MLVANWSIRVHSSSLLLIGHLKYIPRACCSFDPYEFIVVSLVADQLLWIMLYFRCFPASGYFEYNECTASIQDLTVSFL